MNSISWMIYAADVCGSISGILTASGVGAIAAMVGAGVGLLAADGRACSWQDKDEIKERDKKIRGACTKILRWGPVFALGCWTVAAVIPSKSTIYAIAASESMESVARSQTGQKALKALDAWLDQQISNGGK